MRGDRGARVGWGAAQDGKGAEAPKASGSPLGSSSLVDAVGCQFQLTLPDLISVLRVMARFSWGIRRLRADQFQLT